MEIRKATRDDISLLVRMRLAFLQEEFGEEAVGAAAGIRGRMTEYFLRQLDTGIFAYLADVDGETVSSVYCAVEERPASPTIPTGRTATLLNVFTFPEFRRQGIATALLQAAIDEARRLGVCSLGLSATPAGRPVYEKIGFRESRYTSMRLKVEAQGAGDG